MRVIHRASGPLDFVAVGHVTIDHIDGRRRLGGAAAFASLTAARLGLRSGLITSAGPGFPYWETLRGVEVHWEESARTTEFSNLYDGGRRRQRILGQANPITEASLGSIRGRLRDDAAVLYCPVVHETQIALVPISPRGLSGVAPQGFFRAWDRYGVVEPVDWENAIGALARADFVSMSDEDATAPEALAEDFPGKAFAVTRGAEGARVYSQGDVYDLPAFPALEVDPTGAGDVYAAAFLIALRERRPVVRAARFAACAAAFSVEAQGVEGIPSRERVDTRLEAAP
jgi:sugar/nucleoside kinase (ribokinase family)